MESEANREKPTPAEQASSELNNTPSLSKSEAIAALQNTIQQLEEIVTKLDSDTSTGTIPIESSVDTLVTTTTELATTVATASQAVSTPPPSPEKVETTTTETLTSSPEPPKTFPTVPQDQLTDVSTVKPKTSRSKAKKTKKNNLPLIGFISALVIISVGIVWWWLHQKPVELLSQSKSTDIEIVTTTDEPEVDNIDAETEINSEEIADSLKTVNSLDTTEENLETNIESESESIAEIDVPLELEAPLAPKTLELKTIKPEIILTPEQILIAAIQDRVSEITKDYSDDLIVSVEADFKQNSLSIIFSNLWYELSESSQNKLANDILKRSRRLDFQKLAIKNTEGTLIARNPVIGNTAIILQRSITKEEFIDNEVIDNKEEVIDNRGHR